MITKLKRVNSNIDKAKTNFKTKIVKNLIKILWLNLKTKICDKILKPKF